MSEQENAQRALAAFYAQGPATPHGPVGGGLSGLHKTLAAATLGLGLIAGAGAAEAQTTLTDANLMAATAKAAGGRPAFLIKVEETQNSNVRAAAAVGADQAQQDLVKAYQTQLQDQIAGMGGGAASVALLKDGRAMCVAFVDNNAFDKNVTPEFEDQTKEALARLGTTSEKVKRTLTFHELAGHCGDPAWVFAKTLTPYEIHRSEVVADTVSTLLAYVEDPNGAQATTEFVRLRRLQGLSVMANNHHGADANVGAVYATADGIKAAQNFANAEASAGRPLADRPLHEVIQIGQQLAKERTLTPKAFDVLNADLDRVAAVWTSYTGQADGTFLNAVPADMLAIAKLSDPALAARVAALLGQAHMAQATLFGPERQNVGKILTPSVFAEDIANLNGPLPVLPPERASLGGAYAKAIAGVPTATLKQQHARLTQALAEDNTDFRKDSLETARRVVAAQLVKQDPSLAGTLLKPQKILAFFDQPVQMAQAKTAAKGPVLN